MRLMFMAGGVEAPYLLKPGEVWASTVHREPGQCRRGEPQLPGWYTCRASVPTNGSERYFSA